MKVSSVGNSKPPAPSLKSGAETYSAAIGYANNYTNWMLEEFRPYFGSCLLEIGVGHGSFRPFITLSTEYVGIDIDAESVANAQRLYPDDRIFQCDMTDDALVKIARACQVDTILCANVLEHVPNHALGVKKLVEALPSKGHLLLFVPAFKHLYNSLDRLAGHERRYERADMESLIPANCDILVSKYFNPIGGLGWWMNNLLNHGSLNAPIVNGQIEIFDKYILPLSKGLDGVTNRFFGQSLITIVRKR